MLKRLTALTVLLIGSVCANAQVYGSAIAEWDFANGIPENWTIESDGLAQWQYRGPSTIPSNLEGSLGSCGGNSVPINSPTASNGFVIFDANFWDDPVGPCGNFGTGLDPYPHTVSLTTPVLDFSGINALTLTFYQQFNHFSAATEVLISIDGGETWSVVFANPTINSSQNGQGGWATANISAIAGNEEQVQLRFRFSGQYYWWMLDDITVYSPNTFDALLDNPTFTEFDGTFDPDGLGRMEYGAYPVSMIPELFFKSRIRNIGSAPLTNVSLNVTLTQLPSTVHFNNSTAPLPVLNPSAVILPTFMPYTPPGLTGDYLITYTAQHSLTEQAPENNAAEKAFRITPFAYAMDKGSEVEDIFIPPTNLDGLPYQIGCLYQATASQLQIHGMGVAFGEGTTVGTEVTGVVYDHRRDILLAETEPYLINAWDINQIGEDKIVNLTFIEPVITYEDSVYAVMLKIDDPSNGSFYVGRNGSSFSTGSIIDFPTVNQAFFLLRAPIVRAHLFPGSAIPGCLDETAMNYTPGADTDDGSCRYPGCTVPEAANYDPNANFFDGTCIVEGCTDSTAVNFDASANTDDGSCLYAGCTDIEALNYDPTANLNDGSCVYGTAFLSISDSIGCAPHTVVFSNQTVIDEGGSCSFFLNGELYSEECLDEFEITFDEPGEYSMVYTYIIEDIASEYTAGPIVVGSFPDTPILFYDESQVELQCTGCDGLATAWYFNDMVIDDANETTLTPTASGWYTVEVANAFGCATVSDSAFVLLPGAVAAIEANATVGCAPFALSITNLTETEVGSACELRINGEVVSTVCQALYELNLFEGEYTIEFLHTLSDSVTTSQLDLLVNPSPPTPELTEELLESTLTCTNCDGLLLQWLLNGNAITDATDPTLETIGGGVYSLVVTNAEGCSTESAPVVVANVLERVIDDTILYPNPANEVVVVRSSTPVKGWSLYGAEGRLLATAAHPSPKNEIPLTDFATGSYLVHIHFDGYSVVKRLVISH